MKVSGRIAALDVGTVRVGVAITDELCLFPQPGPVLQRNNNETFLRELGDYLTEWKIVEVVVGLPISLSGRHKGATLNHIHELLSTFRQRWPDITWHTWDERFTTVEATRILQAAPKKKRQTKGMKDRLAAQLILESFLSRRNPGHG